MMAHMSTHLRDYDFTVPNDLIAQTPRARRDASRLMVLVRSGACKPIHARFHALPHFLRDGDVLVRNVTRVIPARLYGRKAQTNGAVEILLLERIAAETTTTVRYIAMAQPLRRLPRGTEIIFHDKLLRGRIVARERDRVIIDFHCTGAFEEVLAQLGTMPLPPYITARLTDAARYQTIYAKYGESAAAPTAGLHFTPALFTALKARGIHIVDIELTVGLGTFATIKTEDVRDHTMHEEHFTITREAAQAITAARAQGRRIVAIGTTVVRALESATQADGTLATGRQSTRIFIHPGYRFRTVDALITNFHLPRSSLILLVSAFASRTCILAAYEEAVERRYRFFSFGDAMLII